MSRGFQIFVLFCFFLVLIFVWQFIGIVLIPPIGAIPKGVTVVVWKGKKLSNCETLDSIQKKSTGKATLLGRVVVLGHLKDVVIFRLPYSATLHDACD